MMATNDFDILEQVLSSSNLPDWQQNQLRMQAAHLRNNGLHNNTINTPASHVPRSMSAFSMPIATHLPTADPMDRTHSAPASASTSLGRSTSSFPMSSNNNLTVGNMAQRSLSTLPAWPSQDEDEANSYALYSQSSSLRKQPSLQSINEVSTLDSDGVVEYDPAEYISNCIEPSGTSSFPPCTTPYLNRLHVAQLTPDMQWCPSLDGSISPSTSVGVMTPATISSSSMSRQASYNPLFLDHMSMLRVQSDSSVQSQPLLSEDGSFPFASDLEACQVSVCADSSLFSSPFTGCSSSEVFPLSAHVSPSTNALGLSSQQQLDLVEDMQRSASSSSESNTSYASASSNNSRHSRREREINAQASRKIAPKAIGSNDQTLSAPFNVQMKRVVSADGSSKDVAPITKAPYIRPQHPKIQCPQCNARPEGFRGTHELERHVARAHASVRKGYICIDASADKKFLASCKHCRKGKVYGAYYNAAAHLRRAHFHPRKRGRKGKHDEKRGGIGGGDDPPMDTLKQHWIKEIEVGEKPLKRVEEQQPVQVSVPDNSTVDAACDDTETFDYECMNASYPPVPMTDMSSMPDFNNQFMDQSVFMPSTVSDGSYDPALQYYTSSPNNLDDFQFEACQFQA